jgi:CBS domain-containing protein
MKAREIMTSDPFTVTPSETVGRASRLMRDLDIGCVPVVTNKAQPMLLGLLTDRDVTVRCVANELPASTPVREVMTKVPLEAVMPDTDVTEVVSIMEEAQIRRVPVVSDIGLLMGMIAQADVATRLGPTQPKVVEELVEKISEPFAILGA